MSTIGSMNITLKNNALLLRKRVKRQWSIVSNLKESGVEYNLPNASTKQLREIRKRLQKENAFQDLIVISMTIIIFIALLIVLLYELDVF